MHIHDLARAYQAKTDEELIQLAMDPEHLTAEANSALKSELERRRIRAEDFKLARKEGNSNSSSTEPPENRVALSLPDSYHLPEFIREVLRIYHGHFWFFLTLIAPAVLVGYAAVFLARREGYQLITRIFQGRETFEYKIELFKIWATYAAGYLVSWLAFCFSFGAMCSAVRQLATGPGPSVKGAFATVRVRMGPVLRLSLLLVLLFLVLRIVAMLLSQSIFWAMRLGNVPISPLTVQLVIFGSLSLVFLALSRFGLAMPALVLDDCGVFQSMFRSDELTEGKWLTLAVLLFKSVVGGYLAGMFPFWLARWIPSHISLPPWFPWALTFASVAGVMVVEPPMFIGFAWLYLRMSALPSTPKNISHIRPA